MTFRDSLQQLVNGGVERAAVKRPSWKGYIYYTREGLGDGEHRIVFHYADGTEVVMLSNASADDDIRKGTGSGNTRKVYKGRSETDANIAQPFTDYCPLTTFLMDAVVNATDFFAGTKEDFDAASAGSGEF